MDFSQLIPRQLHPTLRWLGKLNPWLDMEAMPYEKRTAFHVDWDKIKAAPGFDQHKEFLHRILKASPETIGDYLALVWMEAFATCLADGPKLFQPTAEQFDSMQHVELRLPIADYRQPFPAMVVRIPTDSRRESARRTNVSLNNAPQWVMLRSGVTKAGKVFVFVGHHFHLEGKDNTHFFQDRVEFESIEDALLSRIPKEGEGPESFDFVEWSGRACLNLMLMLTHYGHRNAGPLNPTEYAKHRSKKNLQHLKYGDFEAIQMTQHVVVREVVYTGRGEDPIPSGVEMRPHWRKGHWAMQPHGPGSKLRKRIFRRPVLIRPDRIVGDLGDSQAVYTSPLGITQ